MRPPGWIALAVVAVIIALALNEAILPLVSPGNDGDSTQTESGSGLQFIEGELAMLRGCSDNQVIKWDEVADDWNCEADVTGAGGSAIVLDLADDDVNESTDLTEIATTGDTNSVFTESSPDKLLIAVGTNWPTADTADALSANGGNCAAGAFPLGVDAAGASESCTAQDAGTDITTDLEEETHATEHNSGGADEIAVVTAIVTDDTLLEADLDSVDVPFDEECLTFESGAGGDFEWQACGTGDPDQNLFETIDAPSGTDPVADTTTDTLTLAIADCIEIVGTAATDTITIGFQDDCILEVYLNSLDAPADEECLTFESGVGGDFEWQTCGDPDQNLFETFDAPAGTDPVADSATDTLTLAIADCIEIVGNSTTDTVTIGFLDDCILEVYLKAVDAPADEECLTFEATVGDFEWQPCTVDTFIDDTGDTGTGVYDFGGATSFELPNGATPTVDAAGETAVDTTDDQLVYFGVAEQVLTANRQVTIVIENPTDADNFLIGKLQDGITITDIHCIVDPADTAESVVIDIQERNSTGDSPVTVDALITCDNDGAEDDGSLTNPTFDAANWWSVDIGTVTGTVTQVIISVYYTTIRE